ncbi:MAG TPA: hypothetical protein VHL11_24985 [Phototrophicaceae bacterium]|jgi:hypothetical protein|nr:hypothetical protein [Phototrophicaceae bacterium]
MSEKSKIPDSEELLSQVFGFDKSTVESNRDGKLTPEQSNRLIFTRRVYFKLAAISGVGVVILTGILPFLPQSLTCLFSIIILSGLVFMMQMYSLGSYLQNDLSDVQIQQVEGIIQLKPKARYSSYRLEIQTITFNLSDRQFFALKNLEPYTIYFLPKSRRVLSLEWLRDYNFILEA